MLLLKDTENKIKKPFYHSGQKHIESVDLAGGILFVLLLEDMAKFTLPWLMGKNNDLVSEFEARLHKKDKEKTKALVSNSASSQTEENISLEDLRINHRQLYLKIREERKTEFYRSVIEDERRIFSEIELTEAEKRRIDTDARVLKISNERKHLESQFDIISKLPGGKEPSK